MLKITLESGFIKMNHNVALIGILSIFLAGCSIGLNTKTKEVSVSTGLFGGNVQKMTESINYLQEKEVGKMTKADVQKLGFNFKAKNVECLRGPDAMPLIVGDVKNNADLSSVEKIEASAKAADAFEACKFPEFKIKSKKDRWFWSTNKGKTEGQERAFVIVFKNGILFSAKETHNKYRNEIESEKSFGGNILETLIGTGISAGRSFR